MKLSNTAAVLHVLSLVLFASSSSLTCSSGGEGYQSVEGAVFPIPQDALGRAGCHIITITIWPNPQHSHSNNIHANPPSFSQSSTSSSSRTSKHPLMQTFSFSLWLLADPLRLHTTSPLLSPFFQFGFSSDCCAFSNLNIFARCMLVF